MSDEEVRDLVLIHDKNIDKMAMSIEHLASAVGTTNRKLEDIIDVIGRQNILMEKFTNLEIRTKDNFDAVHTKIRDIEQVHNTTGCTAFKVSMNEISTINKRLDKLEDTLKWVVRLIIGGLVSGALGTIGIMLK